MSNTPFRDTAKKLAENMDYIDMAVGCDRKRSHSWWRNVVNHGAWSGPGDVRTAPPDPDAIEGIAKLFGTTPQQVSIMVAADWYGVRPDHKLSARVLRLAPILDRLDEKDANTVWELTVRLAIPIAPIPDDEEPRYVTMDELFPPGGKR